MMKTNLLFLATIALTINATAQGSWSPKTDFGGTSRSSAIGFSIGTKGYIGTGFDGAYKKDFWEYDASNNTWTQKADFSGTARADATAFSIGNKGYIGCGYDGTNYLKDFWEWEQVTNTWVQKTNFGGSAREGAVGFAIGTKGYIGIGYVGFAGYNDFWEWNQTTNTWVQKTNFGGNGRGFAVGFSIGTKGYIGTGGWWTGSQWVQYNSFWEWEQASNTWSQKANFPAASRQEAVGFSIGNSGYIGLGDTSTTNTPELKNDFWEWNSTSNSWAQKINFIGTPRRAAVGFNIGTKGYIGLGNDGIRKKDFYEFDPCNITLSTSSTNVSCNGGSDGSASVTISGGISPYSYLWSNGSVQLTNSNLSAQVYSVTITDAGGCVAIGVVTISQPSAISITVTTSDAICGINNGTALASATGGSSPYLYQWSSGDTTSSIDSLVAGIYMVTVTDAVMCSNFEAVIINSSNAPIISINSVTNVSCYGGNNGAIDINVSGGSTPYAYLWSNGSNTQDLTNLSMSPYEIVVSGADGCSSAQSIFVSQPNAINISVSVNNASCGNADGSATTNVTGGTSPYTYFWSNGATTSQISNLTSQIYTVTITDNNGCTKINSAAVGNTGGATVQIDSVVPAGCGGTGAIYVSVSGGASPYTFSWTNGATTQNLTAAAGNYGLLVTDNNGCTGAISAAITSHQLMYDPICLITVDTVTGTNKLVWEKTYGNGVASYKIYKEQTIAGIYQAIGTAPFDNLSVFTDSVANPLIRSWRYKISAVDSCGNESELSPEHKTIHLNVNLGLSNTVNLIWDNYQGFSFGTYYIYRYTPQTNWVLIDSLPSNLTSWTDFSSPNPAGLRYMIEARHPDGCIATKSVENHNSSRSNKTYPLAPYTNIIEFEGKRIIADVFPNPTKGIFTLNVNSNGQGLSLLVFNLLGEVIYKSKIPNSQSSVEIDVSKNGIGLYYLQVLSENGNSIPIKIVLQ